jgi:hypothetical protein
MEGSAGAATTRRFREAFEAADLEGVLSTLSPDVVLNSPITTSGAFFGLDELRSLMTALFDTLEDVEHFEDFGDEETRCLASRARVGRQALTESFLVRLDDEARIREITVFIRPLPGLTALLAGLGPRLARRRGPAYAAAMAAMSKPLAIVTRTGDKTGARLAGVIRRD